MKNSLGVWYHVTDSKGKVAMQEDRENREQKEGRVSGFPYSSVPELKTRDLMANPVSLTSTSHTVCFALGLGIPHYREFVVSGMLKMSTFFRVHWHAWQQKCPIFTMSPMFVSHCGLNDPLWMTSSLFTVFFFYLIARQHFLRLTELTIYCQFSGSTQLNKHSNKQKQKKPQNSLY